MVSGIRWMGSSGCAGNSVASLYANGQATSRIEIFSLEPGATNNANRLGMFGILGPPTSVVVVGQYQDRSAVCNETGVGFGTLINVKYTGASTASVSGVSFTAGLQNIPQASSTLVCRFTEPNASLVVTQNATFRAVALTAGSGVPDISSLATNIIVQAAQLADTDGDAGDTAWTRIDSGGAALSLADQSAECTVHDYHMIVSASPSAAGRKTNYGYLILLEFF